MLPDDSDDRFEKHPHHEADQLIPGLPLSFLIEVIERLRHGLAKLLPKPSRIEVEKFPVQAMDCIPVISHG